MPTYRVNRSGVDQARKLIASGRYDTDTNWSDAAPSTDEENGYIDRHGYQAWAAWHLAEDTEAGEDTKGRFRFPYGDLDRVNRAALIHAKQRATQNDHDDVAAAADRLLQELDRAAGD